MGKIKNEKPHVGHTLAARGFVKMTSPCHISAYSGLSGSLFHVFLILKNEVLSGEQAKRIHYSCADGIEKSVPCDHQLSSLSKPCDAIR